MPALPKRNPARRNTSSTKALLSLGHDVEAPQLPEREKPWHPMSVAYWADIWASEMAPEYTSSDIHGLYALIALVDHFWYDPKPATAAEIRLQRQCYGLTPLDRRRLQWEIERTDEAVTKGRRRREQEAPRPPESRPDPREALRAVS